MRFAYLEQPTVVTSDSLLPPPYPSHSRAESKSSVEMSFPDAKFENMADRELLGRCKERYVDHCFIRSSSNDLEAAVI